MKILITGANGFVGKNLCAQLQNIKEGKANWYNLEGNQIEILKYDRDTDPVLLDEYCKNADFVFNLAGVNRPQTESEFFETNYGFASTLLDTLRKYENYCPVMLSSSIQAEQENPYGQSKRAGEDAFFEYGCQTGARILVYRFPNLFGKWCLPNYNSVVATFCYNISRGLPIRVNDREVLLDMVYIDDVVDELIGALSMKEHKKGNYCYVPTVERVSLGHIVDLLYQFHDSRQSLTVPNVSDLFEKKLYSTYLSYLPQDQFSYPLKMNVDERGSFTEIIRTIDRGQFSVNISRPHITKGQHWHHTKNEKFVVVSGKGVIRFRDMREPNSEVIEYFVSGEHIEVVDIPTGYTHNIENLGDTDMVTFMWCNECFDPQHPETYYEPV